MKVIDWKSTKILKDCIIAKGKDPPLYLACTISILFVDVVVTYIYFYLQIALPRKYANYAQILSD